MEYVKVPTAVYSLADAVGFTITVHPSHTLTCSGTREMNFEGLEFTMDVKAVSSCVGETSAAILLRATGNLGLLLVAGYEKSATVSLFVVDFARMGVPEGIMEKEKLVDPKLSVDLMKKAIVAQYGKSATNRWDKSAA